MWGVALATRGRRAAASSQIFPAYSPECATLFDLDVVGLYTVIEYSASRGEVWSLSLYDVLVGDLICIKAWRTSRSLTEACGNVAYSA